MFSDYFKQGHDSRFVRLPGGVGVNVAAATRSPVRVRFVEQTVISDGTEITGSQQSDKAFKGIQASSIDGTSATRFQSSNISLTATSAIPFKENTTTNRTYA
jgi:hypothetical protein